MLVYIATKLENAEAAKAAIAALKKAGHEVTYDWTEHGSVQKAGDARIRDVAILELGGVLKAEASIVILPGGRGTHAELGAAIVCSLMRPQRVILVGPDSALLDADGRTCAFYLHPKVERAQDVSAAIAMLGDATLPESLPDDPDVLRRMSHDPVSYGARMSEAARRKLVTITQDTIDKAMAESTGTDANGSPVPPEIEPVKADA